MGAGDMLPTEDHYQYGRRRLDRILKIGLLHPGDKVLDFGAGLGRLALPIKELGCQVICIE